MNGVLIYGYFFIMLTSLIIGFVLLRKNKARLLGGILIMIGLTLILALVFDMLL